MHSLPDHFKAALEEDKHNSLEHGHLCSHQRPAQVGETPQGAQAKQHCQPKAEGQELLGVPWEQSDMLGGLPGKLCME